MNDFNENRFAAEYSTTLTNTSKSQLAKFDYSALDEDDRKYIQRYKERDIRRQQTYYLDTAKDLVEIQSRLAKYGQGHFVKWIEIETNYAVSQVYRLIDVYNYFSQLGKMEQENFIALPKTLQYEVAKPSAPPELVEQVMNGDITTHKEYIRLKKELEETTMLFDYSTLNKADCKIVKRLEAEFTKQQLELIIKINSAKEEVYNKLKEKNQLELYKPWCASLNIDWAEYEPTKEEFETLVKNIVVKIIENAAN